MKLKPEPLILSVVTGMVLLIITGSFVFKAEKKVSSQSELFPRLIFSSATFRNPNHATAALIDQKKDTFWSDGPVLSSVATKKNLSKKEALPPEGMIYLHLELGLTHFPGNPPIPNPLKEITIISGAGITEEAYQAYARPRTIRLIFFRQKVVDVDRTLEFPGLPVYTGELTVTLKDSKEIQTIHVESLPPIPDSKGFPYNISVYWMRMEILDVYKGKQFPETVAISEIGFKEQMNARTGK